MKKHLLLALTLLVLPVTVLAASDSVTLNAGITLKVTVAGNSMSFTVDGNDKVETLQVQGGSIVAGMQSGSTLSITSADRTTFTYSVGGAAASFNCSASNSTLSITSPSAQTVTITPTGSACTVSGGGPGGGGEGTPNPPPPSPQPSPAPSPEPSPAPEPSPSPTGGGGAPVVSNVPAATNANPSPVAQLVSPVFNANLQPGSKGDDVKRLQQLLATDKEIYPEGQATGYFGNLTKTAIVRFQLKYGVIKKATDPGNGNLGPKTRAKLKEIFGNAAGVPTPAAAPTPSPASSNAAEKLQQLQTLLQQVQALQAALKAKQGY